MVIVAVVMEIEHRWNACLNLLYVLFCLQELGTVLDSVVNPVGKAQPSLVISIHIQNDLSYSDWQKWYYSYRMRSLVDNGGEVESFLPKSDKKVRHQISSHGQLLVAA